MLGPLEVPSELKNDSQQEEEPVQQENDLFKQPKQPKKIDDPSDDIVPPPDPSMERKYDPDTASLPEARENVRTQTGRLTRTPRHL